MPPEIRERLSSSFRIWNHETGKACCRPWSVWQLVTQNGWCLQNEEYADLADHRRARMLPGIEDERFHEGLNKSAEPFYIEYVLGPAASEGWVTSDMVGRLEKRDKSLLHSTLTTVGVLLADGLCYVSIASTFLGFYDSAVFWSPCYCRQQQ